MRVWLVRLGLELRRNGGRLRVELEPGARFDSRPDVRTSPEGGRGGTTTLRLGRDADLGRRLILEIWAGGDNLLEVGPETRFGNQVRVELRSGSLRIGPDTQVRDGCVLKSNGELTLGKTVLLSFYCVLHCTEAIALDDFASIGEFTTISDSDHTPDGSDAPVMSKPLIVDPVQIGSNVWVARGAAILRGARIGPNAAVGANAVVTGGDYPGGWVIVGIPAKAIKPLAQAGEAELSDLAGRPAER